MTEPPRAASWDDHWAGTTACQKAVSTVVKKVADWAGPTDENSVEKMVSHSAVRKERLMAANWEHW